MSFSTGSPPTLILEAVAPSSNPNQSRVYAERSSDPSGTIIGTGYYAGMGRGSQAGAGMSIGDLLVHIESTGGSNPGKVSWHCVTASTAAISAADPLPSSAFGQNFNVTVSAST